MSSAIADKEWYKNYFVDIDRSLGAGGCFTAHNIYDYSTGRQRRKGRLPERTQEFLDYVKSLPNYETTVNNSGGGLSISNKKSQR